MAKKIKKALIFIVSLHVISIAMTSCRWICPSNDNFYWNNFRIRVIDNSSGYWDSETIFLDVNNPIEKAKLGFQINPDLIFTSRRQASRAGIISNAQAMISCGWVSRPLRSITSIVIIARSENLEGYQIEVDATTLFTGIAIGNWRPRSEVFTDELISILNSPLHHTKGRSNDDFRLLLRDDSIDLTGKQTFEIIITFNDGVVLTQETDELTLI